MLRFLHLLALMLVLTTLNACATLDRPAAPAPVETLEVPPGPAPVVRPAEVPEPAVSESRGSAPERVTTSPALSTPESALLAQIDAALAAGELDRAGAVCERALRIAPRDARFWYKLADIRKRQGRFDDAEGSAQRALSFAGADVSLTRAINLLLAQVATARGAQ